MTEFKKKVQSIIEDYCEGINHLEFSIDNFPEMLDRIETEALRLHSVSNSIATEYAEFCVRCDRENLPLLCLEDYIKQYCC